MKKILILAIVLSTLLCSFPVCADTSGILSIVVDKTAVTYTDAYPFIDNGRTMIPLRLVSENMQAQVEYDDATGIITITRNGNCKTRDANDIATWTYIEYNGVKYENAVAVAKFQKDSQSVVVELYQDDHLIHSTVSLMDTPVKIIDGRSFVPARYVAYALGYGIFFDPDRNRVVYHYKANQIADFTKVWQYPYDYYEYNSLFMGSMEPVYNYRAFPYRDGYGKIKVLDGDNGWDLYIDRQNNIRGSEVSYMNYMPIFFTFETDEYIISNSKSPEENLETFAKMYTAKMGDKAHFYETDYGYRTDIDGNTYDKADSVRYYKETGEYAIGPHRDVPINDPSLAMTANFSRYDYSKFYILENGEKYFLEMWKSSTADYYASKYNLLTLETFLGEMGERIWTMMDDYYMHTGPFDRGEVYIGTDYDEARLSFREVEIDEFYCSQYGFEFVSSEYPITGTVDTGSHRKLTAIYNGIKFTVNYSRIPLALPQVGYVVTVTELPK